MVHVTAHFLILLILDSCREGVWLVLHTQMIMMDRGDDALQDTYRLLCIG